MKTAEKLLKKNERNFEMNVNLFFKNIIRKIN